MNNNLRFILKTTGIHILTYILCGIIFSTIFSYDRLFAMNGVDLSLIHIFRAHET